ncbi:MAG: MFS transporter [Micromonosporaceae bacterium]
MGLLLVATLGALGSFFLLMPVTPLYVAAGGAGAGGAGLVTGVTMLGTVLAEFAAAAMIRRRGYRWAMALGVLLLGAPSIPLAVSSFLPTVLGACLARGAGLGIVVVAGAALAAELSPPGRRGEGLGLLGVAAGVPSVIVMPLGLWLQSQFGYPLVFGVGAALALVTLPAVAGFPGRVGAGAAGRAADPAQDQPQKRGVASPEAPAPAAHGATAPAAHGVTAPAAGGGTGRLLDALASGGLMRPAIIFAAVTLAAGVLFTFLPLAVSAGSSQVAALALFVQSSVTPLARWLAGRHGDRRGSTGLLIPAILTAALGTAGLVWVEHPVVAVLAMALFGVGFGIAQNATLALMFERAGASDHARISALWNLAYDGGMGAGAVGFGWLAGVVGYPIGFAITGAVLLTALIPACLDLGRPVVGRREGQRGSEPPSSAGPQEAPGRRRELPASRAGSRRDGDGPS